VWLGLVARLEIAAAIALMLRLLAIAFATAMTAASAPPAAAPTGSIVRSAWAAVLAVLRKWLGRLIVSGARIVSSLLA
jgi:hypothetical protein